MSTLQCRELFYSTKISDNDFCFASAAGNSEQQYTKYYIQYSQKHKNCTVNILCMLSSYEQLCTKCIYIIPTLVRIVFHCTFEYIWPPKHFVLH